VALRYREVASSLTGIEKSRKVGRHSAERLIRKDEGYYGIPTRGWGVLFRFEEQGLHSNRECGRATPAQSDRKQCRKAYSNGKDAREGEADWMGIGESREKFSRT